MSFPSATEYPVGTVATKGKRGSLVGAIPEAPSGEAPKGQPMIGRETLEAVCVEAPQGQPRNHRPHPKRPSKEPTGKPEKRDKRRDPSSSPPKKEDVKEDGGRYREPMRGEQAASSSEGRAMYKSSLRRTVSRRKSEPSRESKAEEKCFGWKRSPNTNNGKVMEARNQHKNRPRPCKKTPPKKLKRGGQRLSWRLSLPLKRRTKR